ncbi:NAD(P)/FAD-dependent oxidoreductase [Clostridium botulinum]|nr:NAD(P)/FAD-dependent oxidoreductase [Clostridium botulinum]
MSSKYDAVIIGASLGGLSAALQLGMKGKKALVLEQHNLPGGLATSFVRGRFEFEATLHELQSVGTKKDPRKIRKFLDEAGVDIDWIQIPEAYKVVYSKENIDVIMPYGIDNMIETVDKEVPGTREKMKSLMNTCKEVLDSMNYFGKIGGADKLSKLELLKNHGSFVRTAGYTAKEVIDTFKLPKKAIDIIVPYWIYVGVPLSKLSFTVWAYLMADYFEGGAVVCSHNSHSLSLSMQKRAEEMGARVELKTRVDKILVKKGNVIGVRTNKGKEIECDYVICASYPNNVYRTMIEPIKEVPKEAIKLTNARSIGVTAFSVYLALDVEPDRLNIDSYSYFIGDTMDTDEIWENYKTIESPKYITTIVLNKANPKCFPKGTTEMSITALPKADGWMKVKKEDYMKVKRAYAKAMIDKMNKVLGVNLYDHIEEIEIATPETIARYTGSYNGSVYGYEHVIWDSLIARILEERKERYIKGLEFIGAHASIGNGYAPNITSGIKAATEVLKDMKERRNKE